MSTHKQDKPNHLINAASPYLQQHAYNPVDWYPWGDEAFGKAKRENKPIFLSIGYSTCHWCHVMAHESFENDAIAAILNEHFISIKVDREERPDIDAVYMDFVQNTTGSGGWPMSVFLTPEGKPFYGGTYYPPTDMYGRPGFASLLRSIHDAWENNHDKLIESADQITRQLQTQAEKAEVLTLNTDVLEQAYPILERIYDPNHGGFGGAPKFPQPSMLSFLLVYAHRTGSKKALDMVGNTLLAMSRGGIHDHLGGGFHRYSVDEQWLTPHFEKMLYDQALISRVLIQAFQVTKNDAFEQIAQDIFEYVLRDMTSPEGGFYSAEDADSEGGEGTFYVWTPKQIAEVLDKSEQSVFDSYYGVTEQGNFEHGTSILNVTVPLTEVAKQAESILENAKQKLFTERAKRSRPHRDEKIITGWNGLMISSLAYGGTVFHEPRYIEAAQKSADFVIGHLYKENRMMRYYGRGRANEYGFLEDYAFFIQGLIDLYQADFNPRWLKTAVELTDQMIDLFEDKDAGGFYLTGSDADKLIVRNRPDYDGATPCGNSAAAATLIRLSELTGNTKYMQVAHDTLAAFQSDLKSRPTSLTEMLIAADLWLGPRSEIVIAAATEPSNTGRMLELYQTRFLPRSVILLKGPKTDIPLLEKLSETVKDKQPINGQTTVYLCEHFVCRRPLTDPNDFAEAINAIHNTE